jgi:hypothetical protein
MKSEGTCTSSAVARIFLRKIYGAKEGRKWMEKFGIIRN